MQFNERGLSPPPPPQPPGFFLFRILLIVRLRHIFSSWNIYRSLCLCPEKEFKPLFFYFTFSLLFEPITTLTIMLYTRVVQLKFHAGQIFFGMFKGQNLNDISHKKMFVFWKKWTKFLWFAYQIKSFHEPCLVRGPYVVHSCSVPTHSQTT